MHPKICKLAENYKFFKYFTKWFIFIFYNNLSQDLSREREFDLKCMFQKISRIKIVRVPCSVLRVNRICIYIYLHTYTCVFTYICICYVHFGYTWWMNKLIIDLDHFFPTFFLTVSKDENSLCSMRFGMWSRAYLDCARALNRWRYMRLANRDHHRTSRDGRVNRYIAVSPKGRFVSPARYTQSSARWRTTHNAPFARKIVKKKRRKR